MCRLTADLLQQGFVRLFLGDLTTSWATPKCSSKMPMIYFWSRNGTVYLRVKFSSCSVLFVDGFTGEGTKDICHVYLQQFNSNHYLGNGIIRREIWTWHLWAWLLEVWPLISEQLEWCLLFSYLVMYMGLRWSHHTGAVYSLKERVFICSIFCGQNVVESFSNHVVR